MDLAFFSSKFKSSESWDKIVLNSNLKIFLIFLPRLKPTPNLLPNQAETLYTKIINTTLIKHISKMLAYISLTIKKIVEDM